MKQLLLSVLACGMFVSAFSQDPLYLCCNIIARDIQMVSANESQSCSITGTVEMAWDGNDSTLFADNPPIPFVVFNDDIGTRGQTETRKVFTTLAAYKSYFGHKPPLEVDFATDWVVFYSAGSKATGGYSASIATIAMNGTGHTLKVTTSLSSPGKDCMVTQAKTKPFVLAKFTPPQPNPQSNIFYSDNKIRSCGELAIKDEVDSSKNNTENSDKWVITPVTTMKGVLGRLDINFPADVERNILIHQQADNKFITSVSRNDKIYTIAPDQYRFTLSNVPVDNVPIQKGHETRLKAGFLNVVSEGDWHLYSDTKEKQYTSGNKPKKIPLPVGSYQLKLGEQFYPFVIKDGETVEY